MIKKKCEYVFQCRECGAQPWPASENLEDVKQDQAEHASDTGHQV